MFSSIVWIDKLRNCVKGICFSVQQRNKKRHFFTFDGNGCKEEKMLHL